MNSKTRHSSFNSVRFALVFAQIVSALGLGTLATGANPATAAPSQITGIVFEDFNSNGAQDTTATIPNNGSGTIGIAVDRGVAGVTVTAYDVNNAVAGTATSAANGAYTINIPAIAGPYRVEFTTLPPGYQPSFHGPSNGTSVQFVPDGNTANVNFGVILPANYCQDNPTLVTNCYRFGDQLTDANSTLPTLVSFPYSAGSIEQPSIPPYDLPPTTTVALANQVGTTWGLAYGRAARRLYAGALFKKHAGFGPGGPGAVYIINPATNAVVNTFTVPGATTNSHNTSDFLNDNGNVGWNAAATTSLGGLALSPDESRLYVMNLENRTLYALDASTGAALVSQLVPNPPLTSGTTATCPASDVRPWAVEVYRGVGYIGIVCSAQTSQNVLDLQGFVYTFNLTTLAFSPSPVFQLALNYTRGMANSGPGQTALWNPWFPTFIAKPPNVGDPNWAFPVYPQPVFTSIAFDADGNMVLGIRDRFGEQMGNETPSNPAFPAPANSVFYHGVVAGDTLRACGSPTSGWILENNAVCGGLTTAGQGNGQAPGGGEYYYRDEYVPFHDEVSLGGVLQIAGFPDVLTSVYNPIPVDGTDETTFDGGVRWFNNTTGGFSKAYRVYNGSLANGNLFGKAAGLGDLVALCNEAPIELGNRVWNDTNPNGRQDPGEPNLSGVVVGLYDGGGALLVTTATAPDGTYYFTATNVAGTALIQPGTPYQIRVNVTQAALTGLNLTTPNWSGITSNDAILDVNDSDGILSAGFGSVSFTTGGAGASNHGFDFGFTTPPQLISLGNQVWFDTNNNGVIDFGVEQGVPGVTMQLYQDTNADCIYSPGDTSLGTTTTGAGGYYTFTNLLPSTGPTTAYIVVIPATNFVSGAVLNNYQNSTPTQGCNVQNQDNTNHGVVVGGAPLGSGGFVSSRAMTLTATNLTYDFGFYRLALGNLVWNDTNNNAIFDGGETGRPNVTVRLLDTSGANVLTTTTTDANGIYGFTNLISGTYRVQIVCTSDRSSTDIPSTLNPDNNVDNDDNGIGEGCGNVTSNPMALTPGSPGALGNNIVSNATGSTTNPTLDFGLTPAAPPPLAALGDFEWYDLNRNGIQDPGEPGVPGMTTTLYSNGTAISTTLTDSNGLYLFPNLTPGVPYYVCFTAPQGYTWTLPNQGSDDTKDSDVNPVTGCTPPVTLAPGETNLTLDAGVVIADCPPSPLLLLKESTPAPRTIVAINQTIAYRLTVTNVSTTSVSATNVRVFDTISALTQFQNDGSANPPPTVGSNSRDLSWNLGTLAAGASSSIVFNVKVISNSNAISGTVVRNEASVVGDTLTGVGFCTILAPAVEHVFEPTAITLASFTASLEPSGGVKVDWRTTLEKDSWGFFVLRSATGKREDATKVNADLILAQGANGGASYSVVDPQGSVSTSYWLQEIEISGKENEYGPIKVQVPAVVNQQPVSQQPAQPPAVVIPGGAIPGGVPIPVSNERPSSAPQQPQQVQQAQQALQAPANTSTAAHAPSSQPALAQPVQRSEAAKPADTTSTSNVANTANTVAQLPQTQQAVAASVEESASAQASQTAAQTNAKTVATEAKYNSASVAPKSKQPQSVAVGAVNAVSVARGASESRRSVVAVQPARPQVEAPVSGSNGFSLGTLAGLIAIVGVSGLTTGMIYRRRNRKA